MLIVTCRPTSALKGLRCCCCSDDAVFVARTLCKGTLKSHSRITRVSIAYVAMSELFLFILLLSLHAAAQTCYWPDGSVATGSSVCNPSSAYSSCCGNIDYCLTNGLCFDAYGDNAISRQSCSDQSWVSKSCPQYCQSSRHLWVLYLSYLLI